MIISTTQTIADLPHLQTFLADSPHAVAGWGRKPSGRRAWWLSKLLGRPLAILEDGFIRSVHRGDPTISLLVDDLGAYYDATRPCRMELTIAQGISEDQAARARRLTAAWRQQRISKYNHAPDYGEALPDRFVLVIDQILGDLSVMSGLASDASFARMLDAAITENPGLPVIVKTHPDVFTKNRKSYLGSLTSRDRVHIIGSDCHSPSLLEGAQAVYCVTSLMGFEAMLWDRPVRCFGMPFYAGWGVTQDDLARPARRRSADRDAIVHAALVVLARYASPDDGSSWEVEQAMDYIARERARLSSPGLALG